MRNFTVAYIDFLDDGSYNIGVIKRRKGSGMLDHPSLSEPTS